MPHRQIGFLVALVILLALGSVSAFAGDRVPGASWLRYEDVGEVGFSAAGLAEAESLAAEIGAAAMFVVYRGAVLVDWGESSRRFNMHSARKSLMSALYGIHIDIGSIDTTRTMAELGIDDEPPLNETERTARIVDLLSARSGIYRLAAYEPAQNPKPERGAFDPGTNWCYNNWDFNTLLTILEQETGVKVFEEFDLRFAQPLQMQDYDPKHGYYHYEREKSIHPAYPFRMSARDMARLGLLYLNEGQWGEKQVLSRDYVRVSTSRISEGTWTGGYGYMWWLYDEEPFRSLGMYSARGLGGQTIDVIPEADLVVVFRGDTYIGSGFRDAERLDAIRLILEAHVDEESDHPRLAELPGPPSPFNPLPTTDKQRNRYVGTYPILPGWDFTVADKGGQLVAEFGMGPFSLHYLDTDHLILEDVLGDVHFVEDAAGGGLRLVSMLTTGQQGYARLQMGQLGQAVETFSELVEFFPDEVEAHLGLVRARTGKGLQELGQALADHRRVRDLNPDHSLEFSDLAWGLLEFSAQICPPDLPTSLLQGYAGQYGPRLIEWDEGRLFYSREGRPRREMTPLSATVFAVEGVPNFRVCIERDEDGEVVKLVGWYQEGRRDENLREKVAAE